MPEQPKVSLVIPAFNEAATLKDFLSSVTTLPNVAEVLVINDGSSDTTVEVARQAGARVISHPHRRGNGAAVKTGLRQATQEWIVIMDADGQHLREDLERLLSISWDYDLVIGARDFKWHRFRDFGNLLLSTIATLMANNRVVDLTSGLRRIRRDIALRFLHLYPEGYSFPSTSTLLFLTCGYNVAFESIPNRPRPMHASASKLRPVHEGLRFLSLIYRIILLTYPLRFFAPVGVTLMLAGIGWTIKTLYLTAQVSAGGAMLFLSGLTFLLFGTIADQLSDIRKSLPTTLP